MPLHRHSSRESRDRQSSLYDDFLGKRLGSGATRYDRIAGYFQSSLLELAADHIAAIPEVRIVCNTDIDPEAVNLARMATGARQEELTASMLRMVWNEGNFPHLVDVHGKAAQKRFRLLHQLLEEDEQGKRIFKIRIVPDSEFGFVHGKGGVITGPEGATAFIGSANDSFNAWRKNYELVWEDDSEESIAWVQAEFDALWERSFPLTRYIVKQIERLSARTVVESIEDWREKPALEPLLAEVPTVTELFGFWDHQKYFISLAWNEHLKYKAEKDRGARFLLCDGVGLGKTLQLGAAAKLIGTYDALPILILAPKPLLPQWQEELMTKLDAPSARWENGGWITERNEFFPGLPDKLVNCPRKIGIVSTSVVTSAGDLTEPPEKALSKRNRELVDQLLARKFSCVIWDEAHKIRRANLQPNNVFKPAEKKSLYQFAERLAGRTKSLLLATATPVQLHPMELWDLLHILSINNPQVLGTEHGNWRRVSGPRIFDIVAGREEVDDLYQKWDFWRDPIPAALDPDSEVFERVRFDLDLKETDDFAKPGGIDELDSATQSDLDFSHLREVNPFTQRVIKRSRDQLEGEGKLVKLEMIAHGDGKPILCTHDMEQAFELAEQFAKALHKRVKAAGFIKTLLQRRIGSSLVAGLNTTRKMLKGRELEDDENPNEESLYPLEESEKEILRDLESHLARHLEHDRDPKFEQVIEVLQSSFEGKTWLERGTLIFTQFYDTAEALCQFLASQIDEPIGLYANSSASRFFESGQNHSVDRDLLKEKVTAGRLRLLVGTDAASTGLNLQKLGCLINVDLPWNPTILEQRKGRVQRGTIAKRIPFYNMRYDKGVEQRLFDTLSGRIKDIQDIFGVVPDFIVDDWVKGMLDEKEMDENALIKIISDRKSNPFAVKETNEFLDEDWDSTAEVLNRRNALAEFETSWK